MGDVPKAPWIAPTISRTQVEESGGVFEKFDLSKYDIPAYDTRADGPDPTAPDYKVLPGKEGGQLRSRELYLGAQKNNQIRETRIADVTEAYNTTKGQMDTEAAQIQALQQRNENIESQGKGRRSARYGRSSGTILTSPLGIPNTQGIGGGKTLLGS